MTFNIPAMSAATKESSADLVAHKISILKKVLHKKSFLW